MSGPTHISFAAAIFFGVNLLVLTLDPKLGICLVLGSLLPDIDKHNSMLGRYVYFIFGRFLTHRKQTHSIVVCTAAFAVACFVSLNHMDLWLALFIGILSHILLDLFNKDGVYLLWPIFPNLRISFRIKSRSPRFIRKLGYVFTGKRVEQLIDHSFMFGFALLTAFFIFEKNRSFIFRLFD